ncbi:bacterio-opsin activator domain-containing protein [Haladaptatus sp. DFWS20]|uniref:helix-turn-helix domain-containing protein n=1 Tax=Haladaptatus sp. DFWS20 TaxID=3403467 RepID=UPI003EC0DC1A
MPTITYITLPGESFAFGRLLMENPNMYIEIERLVPLGDRVLPFFWITDGSPEDIEDALESQSIVESVTQLTKVDDRYLYQVTWSSEVDGVVDALFETNGVILEGQGIAGRWELRLRFPEHGDLRRFNDICLEEEIQVEVNGIYNPHAPSVEDQLTPAQWQTLATAFAIGYYDVPRKATLSDLAKNFNVTEQAISQRLRRAMKAVVSSKLFESDQTI